MYKKMLDLWSKCVIRNQTNDCDYWPECEECSLVQYHVVRLPYCWDVYTMDFACEADKHQLATLVHSHIIGSCGKLCLFCEVERIPI
jgi:hypothetical protein